MDTEEIIKEVTKLTQCSNYELLIDGQDATQNVVYKVYKQKNIIINGLLF